MTHQIAVSEEELALLQRLVRVEMDDDRVELRRTRNPDFRARVAHRRAVAEHILHALSQAEARTDDGARTPRV